MTGTGLEPTTIPEGAVVVDLDGSETADRALSWAARYAALEGRPLVIAHAIGMIGPEAGGLAFDSGASFMVLYDQMREDSEALVSAATEKVAGSEPSVAVTTVAEQDDPRRFILRLAGRASLVVMGSRGRGPLRRMLLGSVTAAVAGQAGSPVVVIPAHDEKG
jgi:nucleotide-binding universal stress UspA family protein